MDQKEAELAYGIASRLPRLAYEVLPPDLRWFSAAEELHGQDL